VSASRPAVRFLLGPEIVGVGVEAGGEIPDLALGPPEVGPVALELRYQGRFGRGGLFGHGGFFSPGGFFGCGGFFGARLGRGGQPFAHI
jgi:hypothetical protein